MGLVFPLSFCLSGHSRSSRHFIPLTTPHFQLKCFISSNAKSDLYLGPPLAPLCISSNFACLFLENKYCASYCRFGYLWYPHLSSYMLAFIPILPMSFFTTHFELSPDSSCVSLGSHMAKWRGQYFLI